MSLLVKIGADLSSFEKQMKKATKEIDFVAKKLENVGKELTTKVTLPIVGVGIAALKVGIDFEAAMSEVAAISGATGDDLKAMEDAAKEMGKKTSKSATESADALKYMSLAGWDATTSIKALEPVLRLSEAGNIDLARTSDLVTDSMATLGLSADQLETYLDQVAQTSRNSNTDIDALMEAMVVAGGTFKNLNVPLDEANALLGIMANRGIKGASAGNSLNSIMVNLTSGAGQAGEALEELGINAFDSEGKFKGMGEVLKEVGDKTAGMTEEQRTMYLAMIGGKTQIDTLQALLAGMGDEFVDLQGDIGDSTGVLNEMAHTMQDNMKGSLTRLKSSLEGVGIQLSETLIPMMEKVVGKVQVWVDWFANLDEGTQETIVKVALLVAAIGPLLIVVAKSIAIFGQLRAAALILGPMIGAISWPVIAVIAAIVAVIAIGVLLYKNWDTIIDKLKQFGSFLSSKFEEIKESVSNKLDEMKTAISEKIEEIKNAFSDKFNEIKERTIEIFNSLVEAITGFAEKVYLALGIDKIVNNVISSFNFLKDTVTIIFEMIVAIIGVIFSRISEILSPIITKVVDFVVKRWNNLKDNTTRIFNAVKDVLVSVWNVISNAIKTVTDFIGGIISKAWDKVSSKTSSVFNSIKSTLSGVWDSIKSTTSSVVDSIFEKIKSVFDKIKGTMTKPIDDAKDTIKGTLDTIKSFFTNLVLKLPMPKMPSFSVSRGTATFMGAEIPVPKFKVTWNAKGALFTKPTIFNTPMGMQGFGEAGPEAALPLTDNVLGTIGRMISSTMPQRSENSDGGIIIQNMSVRNDNDIKLIARELERLKVSRMRSAGGFA